MRELFNGVYEEESTEDKNLGQIQSSFGKEAVSFLMSENKETKCVLMISFWYYHSTLNIYREVKKGW